MESHEFRIPYRALQSDCDTMPLLLASDIHFDEPGFDKELFTKDFDKAKKENAHILVNGDVFGAILPSDLKRYTRGNDNSDTDGIINKALQDAEDLFTPYVDNIDMMGLGNHEVSVLKYHHIDLMSLLIAFLNRKRNPKLKPIRHGGYTGYIRYFFEGPHRAHPQKYTIFYNHGQGGNAEVTDGIIDAKRRLYTRADLIWLGHKHKRWVVEIDPEEGMADNGRIYTKKRHAAMTGCYGTITGNTDSSQNGYTINYGEERMRTKQRTGGIHGRLLVSRNGIDTEFVI